MQLRFTTEEVKLLKSILAHEGRASAETWTVLASSERRPPLRRGDPLPEEGFPERKPLSPAMGLDFEELDELADALKRRQKELSTTTREPASGDSSLEWELAMTDHLLEKIAEAQAMV